jgi:hypothetical protein
MSGFLLLSRLCNRCLSGLQPAGSMQDLSAPCIPALVCSCGCGGAFPNAVLTWVLSSFPSNFCYRCHSGLRSSWHRARLDRSLPSVPSLQERRCLLMRSLERPCSQTMFGAVETRKMNVAPCILAPCITGARQVQRQGQRTNRVGESTCTGQRAVSRHPRYVASQERTNVRPKKKARAS